MPSLIWLTDRSRYETGTGRCGMQRYLRYHAGPSGYGYAMKAESVPLTTGSASHQGLEGLATILRDTDTLPTPEQVRQVIARIRDTYETNLELKGFRGGMYSSPIIDETIKEQSTLIHGLVWTIALKFLPWLHKNYRVLEVEQERLHFFSCTCGAGPLAEQAAHDAKGCTGMALMIKTDILAEHRLGRHLAYFEGKTTGWESDAWAEQWETKPQLALGTLDLHHKYGRDVSEIYVVGMSKGSRKKDKGVPEDHPLYGMRRQQSSLCYGYCRPGNPPLAKDDWLPAYEWINEAGESKRVSKAHKRRGVWEMVESDWSLWHAYKSSDPEMVVEEFWARQLPESVMDKVVFVLGPMNRQDQQLLSLERGMKAEEDRWQQILWALYEFQTTTGKGWESPDFQELIDRLIPRSWNCRPFGKEHECEFVQLCFKHAGWQTPLTMGRYQLRRPHHAPETVQAVERGLLVAEAQEIEEE